MKKTLSLLLALVMLCSIGSVALAARTTGSLEVKGLTSQYQNDYSSDNPAKVETELWMQVKAEGQIDVTVPLLLVFTTNIDGGKASVANNYKITNGSTANIAVTGLKVEENVSVDPSTTMKLVEYDALVTPPKDQYGVQLTPATGTALDLFEYKEGSVTFSPFIVPKGDATANEKIIAVDMITGPLSFVTTHDNTGALDAEKGVKLLSITYTVELDTTTGIGTDLPAHSKLNGFDVTAP